MLVPQKGNIEFFGIHGKKTTNKKWIIKYKVFNNPFSKKRITYYEPSSSKADLASRDRLLSGNSLTIFPYQVRALSG